MLKLSAAILFILSLTFLSCDRVKQKGHNVVKSTKEIAANQVDKAFPSYNAGSPDTKHNKKRFEEHLQVKQTPDVSNIYAYGDFIGADYKVLIAFSCDSSTIRNIIQRKGMKPTEAKDDDGLFFSGEFEWWNKDQIEILEPYKVGKEGEWWQYLWYNPKTKQAWYEEFSL